MTATATVAESIHTEMEMGSVMCTKTLPYMRVIPALLGITDMPFWDDHNLSGDGVGKGYGRTWGGGFSSGPIDWEPYGDGWSYGFANGRGVGSGYGGTDGSNR